MTGQRPCGCSVVDGGRTNPDGAKRTFCWHEVPLTEKTKNHISFFHVFCIFPSNNKVLCGLLEGKQVLAADKDSVGTQLAAGGGEQALTRLLGQRLCVEGI